MQARMFSLTFIAGLALIFAGCAMPVEQGALPREHPANPSAGESPAGETSSILARTPTSNPSTAAITYTCPMHKDVVSSQPGKCPKCGMKLVPKAPATQPGAGHVHDHGAHE